MKRWVRHKFVVPERSGSGTYTATFQVIPVPDPTRKLGQVKKDSIGFRLSKGSRKALKALGT
jgi:hypothetical protein